MAKNDDQKKTLTPKLRFPEFRDAEEWESAKLSTIFDLISGLHLAPGEYASDGEIPYFTGPSDFGSDTAGISRWTSTSANVAKRGDTLITVKGSGVGELMFLSLPTVAMGRQLMAARPKNDTKQFVFYLLQTKRKRLEDLAAGNLIPGLSRGDILNLESPVPRDETEQRKIAACLTSLDEWIAAEGRKLETLRAHKKGLMQQLFPQEGESSPRLRLPEFRDAGDWGEKKIGDVCDLKAGDFVAASNIAEQFRDGLYPCYGGNGLRGYVLTFTHEGRYVLVGRQGALCGNVNLIPGRFHATEHALVATPNSGIDTDWLFHALDLLKLNRFSIGQAQPGLSVSVLKGVDINVPPTEAEQQRVAACLSSLDALIDTVSQKLDSLRVHKKGLMQQLFPSPEGE